MSALSRLSAFPCQLLPRNATAPTYVACRLAFVKLDDRLDRPPPLRDALLPRRRGHAWFKAFVLLRQLPQRFDVGPHARFQPRQEGGAEGGGFAVRRLQHRQT